MSRAFSFRDESETVLYDEGVKKDFHILPKRIKEKIKKGYTLSYNEKLIQVGLAKINKDSSLQMKDRQLSWFQFNENNDSLLGESNVKIMKLSEKEKLDTKCGETEAMNSTSNKRFKKVEVGDDCMVTHGRDLKHVYTAKVMRMDDIEGTVDIYYTICQRKERVCITRVLPIDWNCKRSTRRRKYY